MGSKSKGSGGGNNKDKKKYGMGPGQSMAMAGNTGLATASTNQANAISKGLQNLGRDSSFSSIGQNIGEVGSKYRRPANVEGYARKMDMINQGFGEGATTFVGPDGRERINFNKTGLKDDQGRTILSMMNPELTASQPTFNQVFGIRDGDIRRALTGYNSIKYDEPGVATSPVSMVNTPGLIEKGILSPGLAIGKALLNALPSFKNQTQETLPSYYDREGYIPSYQRSDPFNITLKDKPPIPFYIDKILRDLNNSSSTGTGQSMVEDLNSRIPPSIGTGQSMVEDLNSRIPPISEDTSYVDKILKDLTLNNSSRPTNAATGDTLNFVDPFTGTGRSKIDSSIGTGQSMTKDTSYVDKILRDLTLNNSSRPTNATTGDISSIPFRPTLPATEGSYTYPQMFKGEEEPFRDANERIADTIGIPFDSRENQRNNIIEEYFEGTEDTPPTFDPNDPFANLAPEYLPILTSFRNAGYNESDIIDIFRKRNFLAFGGSVAPQSGPMSEGVGTLYRMK